jgi:arylsulfatase A-like enzyme
MVQEMDKGIGQVIQALKETGKLNNTLIIFTSDNGGERYSKNWPFVGRKRDLLEGGLRVPQILSWPAKIAPNKVCQQVCISMDLTATCLEAAGITVDSTYPIDGESLLPILIDKRSEKSRTLFWRMKEREQRSVRDGDWKYLKVKEQEFLFDLSYDWRERTNFASKHPEILSDLKRKWENWNKDMLPMPDHPTPINVNLSDMMW